MQVTSTVRRWGLLAVCPLPLLLMIVGFVAPVGLVSVSDNEALNDFGQFLMMRMAFPLAPLLMFAQLGLLIFVLLALTKRCRVDRIGISADELGRSWRCGWPAVGPVWMIFAEGRQVLAVQARPGTPGFGGTEKRAIALGLPAGTRTTLIAPGTQDAVAQAIGAHLGRLPQTFTPQR